MDNEPGFSPVEGTENLTPEQQFAQKIKDLSAPEEGEAVLTHQSLLTAARLASMPHVARNPRLLEGLLTKVTEEAFAVNPNSPGWQERYLTELAIFGGAIQEQVDQLTAADRLDQTSQPDPLQQGLGDLLTEVRRQTDFQEEAIRIQRNELELPTDLEQQRVFVREKLGDIERTIYDCWHLDIASTVSQLESSLDKMYPEIRREARARINLHDSTMLIRQAGGWIERPENMTGLSIPTAVDTAHNRDHDLTKDVIIFFLREVHPGLDVKNAWDLLQKANYDYNSFVEEINLTRLRELLTPRGITSQEIDRVFRLLATPASRPLAGDGVNFTNKLGRLSNRDKTWLLSIITEDEIKSRLFSTGDKIPFDDEAQLGAAEVNYSKDNNEERKKAVRKFLVEQLARSYLGGDIAAAAKSFELAEKLARATLETSAYNRMAQAGNDQLAEALGFKGWRKARVGGEKGRPAGPLIHIDGIESIGTTWLRTLLKDRSRQWEIKQPVLTSDIDFDQITPDSWNFFGTVVAPQFYRLKGLFLDRAPDPKKMVKRDYWADLIAIIDRADPRENPQVDYCGPKKLRPLLVAGVIDMALADPGLGWTATDIGNMERILTEETVADGGRAFMSQSQWKKLASTLQISSRVMSLAAGQGLRSSLEKSLGR